MTKKYERTDETMEWHGHTLHRIRALKDFGNVKAGDLGGWIESEDNLSQDGNCWVYHEAKVFGNAKVYDNAKVYNHVSVHGNAQIYDDAMVYDGAMVYGNAWVHGNARVFGEAIVYEDAEVYGITRVYGQAMVFGNARVWESAWVDRDAKVSGNARVCGNALVDYEVSEGVVGAVKEKDTDDEPEKTDLFKHCSEEKLLEIGFDKAIKAEDVFSSTMTAIEDKINEAGEKLLNEIAGSFIPLLREFGLYNHDVERIARSIAIEMVRCTTSTDTWMKKIAIYSGLPYCGGKIMGGTPEMIRNGNTWFASYPDELICSKCGKRHLPEDPYHGEDPHNGEYTYNGEESVTKENTDNDEA